MTDQDTKTTESNRDKFRRLANSRLSKALDAIALLESLANKAAYDYDEDDARKMVKELEDAITLVEQSFENGGPVVRERRFF